MQKIPPVPSSSTIPRAPFKAIVHQLSSLPFPVQVHFISIIFYQLKMVEIGTRFTHCRLSFNLIGLPEDLKLYLVLFQELLLTSSVQIDNEVMPYTQVSKELTRDLVSFECGVGFENGTFCCESISQVFNIWAISEPTKVDKLFSWVCRILSGAIFTPDRILTVTQNLLSDLVDSFREGGDVCDFLGTYVTTKPNRDSSTDAHISIFEQLPFLKSVRETLTGSNGDSLITNKLNAIRQYLLQSPAKIFCQISASSGINELISVFSSNWHTTFPNMQPEASPNFLCPFQLPVVNPPPNLCLIAPMRGIESCFLK